jgi:hypothetical protein
MQQSFQLIEGMTGSKRQQGDITSPLDRLGNLALMACAVSGDAAGNNFTPLGNEVAKIAHFLIIDLHRLVSAEAAAFAPGKATAGGSGPGGFSFKSHIINPPLN